MHVLLCTHIYLELNQLVIEMAYLNIYSSIYFHCFENILYKIRASLIPSTLYSLLYLPSYTPHLIGKGH